MKNNVTAKLIQPSHGLTLINLLTIIVGQRELFLKSGTIYIQWQQIQH